MLELKSAAVHNVQRRQTSTSAALNPTCLTTDGGRVYLRGPFTCSSLQQHQQDDPPLLQAQAEAGLTMARGVQQRSRVPAGLEVERDALSGAGTQPVEEAAAAIEAQHGRVWESEKLLVTAVTCLLTYSWAAC